MTSIITLVGVVDVVVLLEEIVDPGATLEAWDVKSQGVGVGLGGLGRMDTF